MAWHIVSHQPALGLESCPGISESHNDADGIVKEGDKPVSSCWPQLCFGSIWHGQVVVVLYETHRQSLGHWEEEEDTNTPSVLQAQNGPHLKDDAMAQSYNLSLIHI